MTPGVLAGEKQHANDRARGSGADGGMPACAVVHAAAWSAVRGAASGGAGRDSGLGAVARGSCEDGGAMKRRMPTVAHVVGVYLLLGLAYVCFAASVVVAAGKLVIGFGWAH